MAAIAVAFLVALAPTADALVVRTAIYSVEAKVGVADLVVRGRIAQPVTNEPQQVVVLDVLKGENPAVRLLTVRVNPRRSYGWSEPGEAIFCLRRDDKNTAGPGTYELVDLFSPPYLLEKIDVEVLTMGGHHPANADELLDAVRAASKYHIRSEQLVMLEAARVPDFPASAWLRVSFMRLIVPADERLERLARGWATGPNPGSRQYAAEVLARFATPDNARLLKTMTRDQARDVIAAPRWEPRPEWRKSAVFQVRQAACATLDTWGIPTGDGKPVEPYPTYADLRWAPWDLGFTCVLLAASTGRRWRRHEPWHWSARVCVFALLALAIAAAHFAWRSYAVADCASLSFGGTSFEICSASGGVHVLAVADQSAPRAIVVKATDTPTLWFAPLLTPARTDTRLGFSTETGQIAGQPKPYAYRLTRIPFYAIITPLAALPLIVGVARLTANLRRHRRRRRGRCPACGYDLRGAPGPRCPECGAPFARVARPSGLAGRAGVAPKW
jgi:hypothetical protein